MIKRSEAHPPQKMQVVETCIENTHLKGSANKGKKHQYFQRFLTIQKSHAEGGEETGDGSVCHV